MEINGLKLPSAFVQDLQRGHLHRQRGSWELKKNESAYDEPLETELSHVFESLSRIQKETDELPEGYTSLSVEDVAGYTDACGIQVGEISYIWDFSHIVCFAVAGDGAPFCFDYREDPQEPRVIWWADAYWQRVAPNYTSFIQLFDIPAHSE
jgi:hypothetical protein